MIDRKSSRTHQMFALIIGAVLAFNLWGCSTPAPAPRELTAAEVLEKTAAKMQTIESLHFQMEMTGGTMTLGPGIKVSKVEGDAAKPDKINLRTRATLAGFAMDVELVSASGKQFLRNPLTKQWDALQVDLGAANLLDPEKGALTILREARGLKRLPNEELDGAKVFHVVGTVASSAITAVSGGAPSGKDVTVDAWIGVEDFVLRKVVVAGSVIEGEPEEVSRTIVFSQFNQPVKIELPR